MQALSHARELRALARKKKGEFAPGSACLVATCAGRCLSLGGLGECSEELFGRTGGDRQTDFHRRTSRREAVGEPVEGEFGVGTEVLVQSLCLPDERRLCLGGEHEERWLQVVARGCVAVGSLLEDHVRVGTAETERADPGEARLLAGPRARRAGEGEGGALQPDSRVEGAKIEVARDSLVGEDECRFDQTGDSSGGLEVTDIGLQGSEYTGGVGGPRSANYGPECFDFDRIAEGRAGAMGLDKADRLGVDSSVVQGRAQERLLGEDIRSCEPRRAPILVDRRAADHCPNAITVAGGIGESPKDDDAATLAADEAVGPGIKGSAASVR